MSNFSGADFGMVRKVHLSAPDELAKLSDEEGEKKLVYLLSILNCLCPRLSFVGRKIRPFSGNLFGFLHTL